MSITWKEEFQNSTGVSVLQSNFPTLITEACLSAATKSAWFTAAATDGADVQVYLDDACTIRMAMELVSWDNIAETFEIHSLYGSLGVVLNKVYLAIDDAQTVQPAFTDTYGRDAVWAGYTAVYHLNSLLDSTGNGYNLTVSGNPSASGASPFGTGSYAFTGGGSNWLENTSWANVPYPYTVSIWHKPANTGSTALISQGDLSTNFPDSLLLLSGLIQQRGNATFNSSSALTVGQWYNMSAVYEVDDTELFMDGVSQGTHTPADRTAGTFSNLYVGGFARASSKIPYVGNIAEVRYTPVRQTAAWAVTEEANLRTPATFWVGQGGAAIGGGTPSVTLTLTLGAMPFTGEPLSVSRSALRSLDVGSSTFSGSAISISRGASLRSLLLTTGSYLFQPQALSIARKTLRQMLVGSMPIMGETLTLSRQKTSGLSKGTLSFATTGLLIGRDRLAKLSTGLLGTTGNPLLITRESGSKVISLSSGRLPFVGTELAGLTVSFLDQPLTKALTSPLTRPILLVSGS